MKRNKFLVGLFVVLMAVSSCIDLTETNEDPNELTNVQGHLLLSTVLSSTAGVYTSDNYTGTRISSAVQYLQRIDGASDNLYAWGTTSWSGYYDILRNNLQMIKRAESDGNNYYYGAGMVMKAFIFGYITDLWGDCPYTEAVQGDKNIFRPKFDSQETVYKGILQDLELANEALAKGIPAHYSSASEGPYDLAYKGDITKWRKMANSLALRYYMRLSVKLPDFAKAGVEKIMGNPSTYPIFDGATDNCSIAYPGANQWDSWPGGPLNWPDGDNFRKRRPCSTLIDRLGELNDPRQAIWFTPVQTQIVIDNPPYEYTAEDYTIKAPAGSLADSLRYIHDNAAILKKGLPYDTKSYVGLEAGFPETDRFEYNLTKMDNDAKNPSVSYFTPMFQQNANELVKSTLISYAEVCFILSEAAYRGWNAGGTAEDYYKKGIQAALTEYKAATSFTSYYAQTNVTYNATLERIMEQKWIAMFLQPQSWFDWRRTGLPELKVSENATKPQIPVRYKYQVEEARNNTTNYNEALKGLEKTQYSDDGADDEYSKMWVIQGTGKPW